MPLEASSSSHTSFTAASKTVELGHDNGLYLARVNHGEQTSHAGRCKLFADSPPSVIRLLFALIQQSSADLCRVTMKRAHTLVGQK